MAVAAIAAMRKACRFGQGREIIPPGGYTVLSW